MSPRLVFLTGSRAGNAFELGDGEITFGRAPDRTIVFSPGEVLVSAEHATLIRTGDGYLLRDDGSRNGTFVNTDQISQRRLTDRDVIQFGAGGPTARYQVATPASGPPTLDPDEMVAVQRLVEQTKRRMAGPRRTTREMVAITYQRFTARTVRAIGALALLVLAGTAGILWWQQRSRAQLEKTLAELARELSSERASRVALQQDLTSVGDRYDSLKQVVADGQKRLASDPRLDRTTINRYSKAVALLVFSYGFVQRGSAQPLRYAVDGVGAMLGMRGPDGQPVPAIRFGGAGPLLEREGTATGFLVDSAGWLITNRHVAEPWADELERMQSMGLDVTGKFLELRAYFPPGDRSYPVTVDTMSPRGDVAVLKVVGTPKGTPVIPLAEPTTAARPGDQLILIGYPTGPYNLLFRVDESERAGIMQRVGDDARKLVDELARRKLVQPMTTDGTVSDTTASEVIHTAATTVGGSGGPLIDVQQRVVAIHHAMVIAPTPGDPFRTQRGVPIRYAWEILRPAIRAKIKAANVGGTAVGRQPSNEIISR